MKMEGYEVVEKAHVTYVTPEGNRVRGNTLGSQYTKEALNLYWTARDHQRSMFQMDLLENEGFGLSDIVYQSKEKLTIKIPLGKENTEEQNCYLLPFDKNIKANTDALYTYLRANQTYDICTEDGEPVTSASGHEIVQSIEDLRDESLMILRREKLLSDKGLQEKRRLRKEKEEAEKERIYYENEKFRNRRTGQPYRVSVYDEDGRPRSTIELVFILALVILDKEELLWEPPEHYSEQENEIFFASTNWKIQYLVDAIELAREEALETPAQLNKRLDIVGADLSRTKYAIKAVTEAKEKMDRVAETVADYKRSRVLAESIMELPEDEERCKMESRYAHVLENYQKTRQCLEKFRIMNDTGIRDFERRYERIQQDIAGLEERKAAQSEHYRRLKKLKYSLQLAEDPRYLYRQDYVVHEKNEGKKNKMEDRWK